MKLNEEVEKNVNLSKDNGEQTRKSIVAETADSLTDVQKEKFAKLTEEIEYSNAEDFKTKVETVKESYFADKAKADEQLDNVAAAGETSNEDLSNAMAAYAAAISKTKDIKIS